MAPDWKRVREVFERALEHAPGERATFLDRACGDEHGLRQEVEALLAAEARPGAFLIAPVAPGAAWRQAETVDRTGADPRLPAGTLVEGKYRIEALVGSGGMGEVYSATQLNLHRPVALKLMRGSLLADPAARARFEREARAVARLSHPNLVTVHDLGVAPDLGAYIVMEYVAGRSLRQELDARGRLPAGDAVALVRQVCAGVAAAHASGVLHRDLKPENILLEGEGGAGLAKVVDFGIAKLVEGGGGTGEVVTQEGVVLGTPTYMAPEQCRGEAADARTDVYALGCVLYELLTGAPPFLGPTSAAVLARHLADPAPVEPLRRAGVGAGLEAAVARALAKAPDARFVSAGELSAALEPALAGAAPAGERPTVEPAGRTAALPAHAGTNVWAGADTGQAVPRNNLPQAVTRFVGREREIAGVHEWLARARLVTLVGPGGIGKTRLALEAAWQAAGAYPDGVWLIELASLADPDLVAQAVAAALGVREEGGRPLLETLAGWVEGKQLLLVLDNCEHLVEACARLAQRLLGAGAGLRVLATSREALEVGGEAVWSVSALELPAEEAAPSLDCEAARLFVDRATLARPGFDVAGPTAPVVAAICRRLEGIPLAIELAAARVKALSVEQILSRLDDRFRLLSCGNRTAATRQQALRATLDWSYRLLEEEERALLRRLSVFSGGWTLSAAERVASCELRVASEEGGHTSTHSGLTTRNSQLATPFAADDVLDGLTRLVNKSLVVVQDARREARYSMLETIREYASEHLRAAGEAEIVRRAHAEYFLALGEAAEPELTGARAAEWVERLEAEHDNVRAALGWLAEHDAEACLRLASIVRILWHVHGHLREGRRWLEAALERSPAAPAGVRLAALRGNGDLARQQGDFGAARACFEESMRIAGEAGDERQIAWSSHGLGILAMQQGDLAVSRAYFEKSLASGKEVEDDLLIAHAFNCLGEVARLESRWTDAHTLYEQAVAVNRGSGYQDGLGVVLCNLGSVLYEVGDLRKARACYGEALAISQALGNKGATAWSLDGLGAVAAMEGASARAARLAGAAEALREAIGYELDPADRAFRDRYLQEVRERLGEAGLEAALGDGRALTSEQAVSIALDAEG
jgi:non-specific serine/threonine protein kinase